MLMAGIVAVGFAAAPLSVSAAAMSTDTVNAVEYDMSKEPSYRRVDLGDGNLDASTLSRSSGFDMNYTMPEYEWRDIYYPATAADIVVTKDYSTMGVDHGHAALMVTGVRTVEHYGPQNDNLPGADGKSDEYYLENLWIHTKTCRLYRYDGLTSAQKDTISNYARNNLTGWNYDAFASRDDSSKMNCATLVWKAYNAGGITLNGYWTGFPSYTMLPSDFVEQNPKLSMVASVGWNSGEHSWK